MSGIRKDAFIYTLRGNIKRLQNNLDKEITNSELADIAGYSVSAFTHRFKTEMNESVQAYK